MARRQNRTEEELRKELLRVPELALPATASAGSRLPRGLDRRALALRDLPLQDFPNCQLGKEAAEALQGLSFTIRQFLQEAQSAPPGGALDFSGRLREKLLADDRCHSAEAIPALLQILQVENQATRLVLIEILSRIHSPQASRALASRALFDLAPAVREAAVKGLRDRPAEEYRDTILAGLDYAWDPVADHAAEALVALDLKTAVPQLVQMYLHAGPEENPVEPKVSLRRPKFRELVRINHLRSCVLCHAPSSSDGDLLRAGVPVPGQPLPSIGSPQPYGTGSFFVRADVTFLRQDFSVLQPVPDSGVWPSHQRYDYVVRAVSGQAPELGDRAARQREARRQAVLFALGGLTGGQGKNVCGPHVIEP
jgi:hypothetical protein